jgi:hypothetical protein
VDLPDYRRIIDDIEAGNRHYNMDGVMMDIRDGYPATERIYGGKGSVKLSREWMIYVNRINGIDGCKYQFVDFENYPTCHIFKPNVGWHNKGYDNLIEQLTFAGNIVDVISIEGDRAYIRSFYNDQMPPAPIWPDKDHLDPKVQLFTTQFKTKLDVTTNGKYPRTLIIANPGERLWIDVANLRPIALVIPPENEVDMTTCKICGTELICPNEHVPQPIPETEYELWIDVYQGNGDHNWQVLADNGVTGIIGKMGYGYTNSNGARGSWKDSRFRSNSAGAIKAGLKYAGFWWTHPLEDLNRQVKTIIEQSKDIPLEFIANDMEQTDGFGRVWNKKRKRWIFEHITKISANQISYAGQYINAELDKAFEIPILTYTRNSFIDEFAPDMLHWMKNYGYWISQLPFEHVFTCDKAEAEAKGFTYCPTWKEYFEKYAVKPDAKVILPEGITDWKIRQFSFDKVKLPGSSSYMDLNWMKKTA